MPHISLPTPTLHTARLLLRPFTEADTDAIFALHSSARVLRYWDAPPWKTRAQAERFVVVCRKIEQEGSGARLAIERAADGVFIGWCCLIKWDPDYRSATMGYCLDDTAWGQGFATEAAGALLQWGFDTLDLNRVQAETDTRNAASSRVLRSSGLSAKVRCGKIALWMARSRIPGCMGFSGGNGSRRCEVTHGLASCLRPRPSINWVCTDRACALRVSGAKRLPDDQTCRTSSRWVTTSKNCERSRLCRLGDVAELGQHG